MRIPKPLIALYKRILKRFFRILPPIFAKMLSPVEKAEIAEQLYGEGVVHLSEFFHRHPDEADRIGKRASEFCARFYSETSSWGRVLSRL